MFFKKSLSRGIAQQNLQNSLVKWLSYVIRSVRWLSCSFWELCFGLLARLCWKKRWIMMNSATLLCALGWLSMIFFLCRRQKYPAGFWTSGSKTGTWMNDVLRHWIYNAFYIQSAVQSMLTKIVDRRNSTGLHGLVCFGYSEVYFQVLGRETVYYFQRL